MISIVWVNPPWNNLLDYPPEPRSSSRSMEKLELTLLPFRKAIAISSGEAVTRRDLILVLVCVFCFVLFLGYSEVL